MVHASNKLYVILKEDLRECEMIQSGNLENEIDLVLKSLKDKEFTSIFFLLMDYISPTQFFNIFNMDICQKKSVLKKLLKQTQEEEQTLVQVLALLQKNNLLRLLNVCKHTIKKMKIDSFDKISPLWRVMYSVCELITSTKDITPLMQALPRKEPWCEYPEIILVHAYTAKLFSDTDLTKLSSVFRKERPDISSILDKYNGKVCYVKHYPIRSPTRCLPCGLAIIISHEHYWSDNGEEKSTVLSRREDSPVEAEALKEVWDMFGFQTRIYYDLKDNEVIDLFKKLAETDHSSYDVFVACYMSHGADGVVFASNSKPILISDLVDIISNNCRTLLNKPKLFFIQACQGSQVQKGISAQPVKLPTSGLYSETIIESNTPLNSDVLKVVSSIPGYTSFAAVPDHMGWFIQSLVSNMKEYGKFLDIINIVVKVQDEVSQKKGRLSLQNEKIENCKQTVMYVSTLRRCLKLKQLQDNVF